jgi:predicted alpha/beta-hydrolase family hydrolase
MSSPPAEHVKIPVNDAIGVSGLLQMPARARACFVVAHGAGAGMQHPFMANIASELAARSIATLRYQFPYMEKGSRRPDPPKVCDVTIRAAVSAATRIAPELPLIAGGKSFGGRMTSQAQAAAPLPGVRGLAFLGFPLHPPGQPSDSRADHLGAVRIPMLFLQGTRDEFAALDLLRPLIARLGNLAALRLLEDADHSFHVRSRGGRSDAQVRGEMLDAFASWTESILASPDSPARNP